MTEADRIAELEEEVRQLRAQLAKTSGKIPPEYGLSKTEAAIFGKLIDYQTCTIEMLLDCCRSNTSLQTVNVHMWAIRKRLKPWNVVIQTVIGVGWRLEPSQRDALRAYQGGRALDFNERTD